MTVKEQLGNAVELLRADARPVRIILFGSRARGQARKDSDIDLLVVEKEVKDRDREMVRLQDCLRRLRINADLVVVSEKKFREWKDTPGNLIYHAAKEGKVLYEMERTSKKSD
jgi:predicted nucleotidyltransferase